jgi:hypothetical protein
MDPVAAAKCNSVPIWPPAVTTYNQISGLLMKILDPGAPMDHY